MHIFTVLYIFINTTQKMHGAAMKGGDTQMNFPKAPVTVRVKMKKNYLKIKKLKSGNDLEIENIYLA